MQVTLNIPEELAMRLDSLEHKLPQILELGLRELNRKDIVEERKLLIEAGVYKALL